MKPTLLFSKRYLNIFDSIKSCGQFFVKRSTFIFLGLFLTLTVSCSNDDENKSNTSSLVHTAWVAEEYLNISGIDTTVEVSLSFLENNKGIMDGSIPNYLEINLTSRYAFNYTYSEANEQG